MVRHGRVTVAAADVVTQIHGMGGSNLKRHAAELLRQLEEDLGKLRKHVFGD